MTVCNAWLKLEILKNKNKTISSNGNIWAPVIDEVIASTNDTLFLKDLKKNFFLKPVCFFLMSVHAAYIYITRKCVYLFFQHDL